MDGLGALTFDDHDDDCQARAVEVNNKDWCKPLQASMSRLAQMQPTVCNMFLQDAGSLKPPKSMSKLPRDRKQQDGIKQVNVATKFSPCKDEEENGNIGTNQNSARGLSKTTAWGSNSSIPDLMARQKSQPSLRPSSASKFPPRNRPNSAGKSTRPQSAKDFLSEKKEEASKDLGIRGSKKQVDSRPAVLTRCNSDLGVTLKGQNPDVNSLGDSAVRSSPIPNFLDSAIDKLGLTSQMEDNENKPGTETDYSKSAEVDEHIPYPANNLSVRASQEEDKPVSPPIPESIRFSLPNMNDGSDEDDEDEDELDTDRLLQQVDSFMQKKSKEEQHVLDSLADANATIPDTENSFETHPARSSKSLASSGYYSPDCPISNVAAHNSNVLLHDKVSHNSIHGSDTDGSINVSHGQVLRSPHVTWSDSHTVRLFQTDSSTLFDGDMTSGTAGSQKTESLSRMSRGKRVEAHPITETFKNHSQTYRGNSTSSFFMPDEGPISYKPLEVTKSGTDRKSLGTKTRPDSGRKEHGTKNLENEHVRSCSYDIAITQQSSLTSCLSQKSDIDGQSSVTTGQEPTHKLVPTVTLAYDDEDDEEQHRAGKHHEKKKLKKRKTFDEIETYMSRLDKEESEATKGNLKSNLSNSCSCGDVSCEELLAHTYQPETLQRPGSASKSGLNLITGEKTPVVKTTKTIEFCDGDTPAETVIRNTLVAANEGKPEKPESRQRSDTTSLLRPSMIKRQQATEDKPKPKSLAAQKIASTTEKVSTTMFRPSKTASKVTRGSAPGQSEGGLAPPHTDSERLREEKSDQGLYETLLEEAKSMALSSMMEAAKAPTPGKKKTATKPRSKISISAAQEVTLSSASKPRPFSAPLKIASSKPISRTTTSVPDSVTGDKHKYCHSHSCKTSSHTGIRRAQSAKPVRVVSRLDTLVNQEDKSPEMYHAQRMQMKMAAMGVQVDASVLERALFPPSGKSIYYNVPGDLPRNPTESLIPHFKHWLAEDYQRVKLMERRLARDDEIKYLQRVAAQKKPLLQKKGKKKKKAEKSVTSAG